MKEVSILFSKKAIVVNGKFLVDRLTGSARFSLELLLEVQKIIPSIEIVSPVKIRRENEIISKFKIKTFGFTKGIIWEQIELPIYLFLKSKKPLLVNLTNSGPIFYKRKVITILDLIWKTNPEWFSRRLYLYHNFITPKLLKSSLAIVTISNYTKEKINEIYAIPKEQIHVVACAVSSKMSVTARTNVTSFYGRFILAVSSIDPRKNFDRLMHAFDLLNMNDVKLILVGQTNAAFSKTKVSESLDALGKNVIYLGYINDDQLIDLYKNAEVFVYPSLEEGFGIPPLEAMMNGCPVIASNASSIPEVCGDAAYYVDPYNVNDITEGMRTVLNSESLKQELKTKGQLRVRHFSWSKSAEKLVNVIKVL